MTPSEDDAPRFRERKRVYEERKLVKKLSPRIPNVRNKSAVTIFGQRSVIAPVLDSGELFKDYDLHKVSQLSTSIEKMDAVTLNYCLASL